MWNLEWVLLSWLLRITTYVPPLRHRPHNHSQLLKWQLLHQNTKDFREVVETLIFFLMEQADVSGICHIVGVQFYGAGAQREEVNKKMILLWIHSTSIPSRCIPPWSDLSCRRSYYCVTPPTKAIHSPSKFIISLGQWSATLRGPKRRTCPSSWISSWLIFWPGLLQGRRLDGTIHIR